MRRRDCSTRGPRHKAWIVLFHPWLAVEHLTTPAPMTESEAVWHFRDIGRLRSTGLAPFRYIQVQPDPTPDRCAMCGQLMSLHRRDSPQFERCYA